MGNKKNKIDYRNLAKKKGFNWVGKEIPLGTKAITAWECVKKHIFFSSYDAIQSGKKCSECAGRRKKTISDYHKLAKEKGFLKWFGDKLPEKVINKTMWMCEYGHVFESSYNKIKSGARCKVCIGYTSKKTLEDFKKLAKDNNFTLLENKIITTRIPVWWQCKKCGYKWKASYDNINRGTGCSKCKGQLKITSKQYHKLAASKNYKWVGDEIPQRTVFKTNWVCDKGHTFEASYHSLQKNSCNKCSGYKKQLEIFQYVKSITQNKVLWDKRFYYNNNKNWFEADIYIPKLKLAIEHHGLFWHCDNYKDALYHKRKYEFFKKNNIRLIQIFEDEWTNKQEIVKAFLKSLLGNSKKVYARKTDVREVSHKEAFPFLEENHLQGKINSSLYIAIYHKNTIVSLMSFGRSRFEKDTQELLRFCNKKNITVVGGFSKLLKYYVRNHMCGNNLISYCDLRYFDGHSYIKNGFEFVKETKPNYYYFYDGTIHRLTRHKFQKKKLHNILEKFVPDISETENMKNNGYRIIYDAGNLKLIYRNEV